MWREPLTRSLQHLLMFFIEVHVLSQLIYISLLLKCYHWSEWIRSSRIFAEISVADLICMSSQKTLTWGAWKWVVISIHTAFTVELAFDLNKLDHYCSALPVVRFTDKKLKMIITWEWNRKDFNDSGYGSCSARRLIGHGYIVNKNMLLFGGISF